MASLLPDLRIHLVGRLCEWITLRWEKLMAKHTTAELWLVFAYQMLVAQKSSAISLEQYQYDEETQELSTVEIQELAVDVLRFAREELLRFSGHPDSMDWFQLDRFISSSKWPSDVAMPLADQIKYFGKALAQPPDDYLFVYSHCKLIRDELCTGLNYLTDWMLEDHNTILRSLVAYVLRPELELGVRLRETDLLSYHDSFEHCKKNSVQTWPTLEHLVSCANRSSASNWQDRARNYGDDDALLVQERRDGVGGGEEGGVGNLDSRIQEAAQDHGGNILMSRKHKRKIERVLDQELNETFPFLVEDREGFEQDPLWQNLYPDGEEQRADYDERHQDMEQTILLEDMLGQTLERYTYNGVRGLTLEEIELEQAFPGCMTYLEGDRPEDDDELLETFGKVLEENSRFMPPSRRFTFESDNEEEDAFSEDERRNEQESRRIDAASARRELQDRRAQNRYLRQRSRLEQQRRELNEAAPEGGVRRRRSRQPRGEGGAVARGRGRGRGGGQRVASRRRSVFDELNEFELDEGEENEEGVEEGENGGADDILNLYVEGQQEEVEEELELSD